LPATVTESGAIALGRLFEVDGYCGRAFRVVTHFHSDHALGLGKSARSALGVISTKPTLEALKVLGYDVPEHKAIALEYRRALELAEERVTLVESNHVFGSCQVLVESEGGELCGYTSDFKLPGTPAMRDLDWLVIDATYGAPHMVRPFKREVEDLFADLVSTLLSKGRPVAVLAYHGKLQEAMAILRKRGLEVPFLMPRTVYELTKVAVKHGVKIDDYFCEESIEGAEVARAGWYVYFAHALSKRPLRAAKESLVALTGWVFDEPVKRVSEAGAGFYAVGLSDHADFEDLLSYLDEARPKRVVVDAFRAPKRAAFALARELERIGLAAVTLPRPSAAAGARARF